MQFAVDIQHVRIVLIFFLLKQITDLNCLKVLQIIKILRNAFFNKLSSVVGQKQTRQDKSTRNWNKSKNFENTIFLKHMAFFEKLTDIGL